MISLESPDEDSSLAIFAEECGCVWSYRMEMQASEDCYMVSRSPSVLAPIGLCSVAKKFMLARYNSPSVNPYRTKWIDNLREDHGLCVCPMCGATGVSSLDHFLPKEDYPELSCFPHNLVPSCEVCNKKRGRKSAKTKPGFDFLHPYFDADVIDALELRIIVSPPFEAPSFSIKCISSTGVPAARIKSHLDASINKKILHQSAKTFWNPWWRRVNAAGSLSAAHKILNNEIAANMCIGKNSWLMAFMNGLNGNIGAIQWMITNKPA